MLKIGIIGATGRMGKELIKEVVANSKTTLTYCLVRSNDKYLGTEVGKCIGSEDIGLKFSDNIDAMWDKIDVVVDFTNAATSLELAPLCAKHKKIHIIGSSGIFAEQEAILKTCAKNNVMVFSSNMSLGANILSGLVKQTAVILGEEFDIEILEMHHRYKKDAPSGTAFMLGEAAALGRNVDFKEKSVLSREGITGERKAGDIGFATLRGGSVVGDHKVIFAGDSEIIELSHKAVNRNIFAKGAIYAALWASGQKPGFYSMQDVLFGGL